MSAELPKRWYERLAHLLFGEHNERDALLEFLRNAEHRHVLSHDTLSMMEGALAVAEMSVKEILIPKSQMVAIVRDAKLNEILPIVLEHAHSRYPVIGTDMNDVIGILLAKDLLQFAYEGAQQKFNLRDILRPAVFVPESKRLNALLRDFLQKRNHIAIVVDEYGSTAGIVTMEDVIERIVGNIEDEYDVDEEPMITQLGATDYSVQAQISIEDFNDYFHTEFTHDDVETIGGLIIRHLGHLPKRNDTIEIDHYHFKIVQADSRRILLLHVSVPEAQRQTDEMPSN